MILYSWNDNFQGTGGSEKSENVIFGNQVYFLSPKDSL